MRCELCNYSYRSDHRLHDVKQDSVTGRWTCYTCRQKSKFISDTLFPDEDDLIAYILDVLDEERPSEATYGRRVPPKFIEPGP